MNKFALIGKDISHSRSPEMYRKLISPNVHYDLLDYKNPSDIPSVLDLLNDYDGINITSPYKKHFLNDVTLTESAQKTGAINCLKKEDGTIFGENTDYLAILDILKKMNQDMGEMEVIILGDGVMSVVAQVALKKLGINFKTLSRKLTDGFNQLNLDDHFQLKNVKPVVINTCSREYIFAGDIPKETFFWDFNYNFTQHSALISKKVATYTDGLEMLERQAFYAVAFWSTKHNR